MKFCHLVARVFCALALLTVHSGTAVGEDAVFTAEVNQLWSEAGNWNRGVVPNGPEFNVFVGNADEVFFNLNAVTMLNELHVDTQATVLLSGDRKLVAGPGSWIDGTIHASTGAEFDGGGGLGEGAQLRAYGGAIVRSDASTYTSGMYGITMFEVSGVGSVVDVSGVKKLDASTFTLEDETQSIIAAAGGVVDLSSLEAIRGGSVDSDSELRLTMTAGGSIDLSSLDVIDSGFVGFEINGSDCVLPALKHTGEAQVNINLTDAVMNLPDLDSFSNGIVELHNATLAVPTLNALTNTTIELSEGSTLSAPAVTDISGLLFNFNDPESRFEVGPVCKMDGAAISVVDGATFGGSIVATSYVLPEEHGDALWAFGAGSVLELPFMEAIIAQGNGSDGYIGVSTEGVIKLPSLRYVGWADEPGSQSIELSVDTGGSMYVGDLTIGPGSSLSLESGLFSAGDLRLGTGLNLMPEDAILEVAGDLIYHYHISYFGGTVRMLGDASTPCADTPVGTLEVGTEFSTLSIGPGATIRLVNNAGQTPSTHEYEDIYVETLIFEDAAGLLNVNGMNLEYATLIGDPSQIVELPPRIAWSDPPSNLIDARRPYAADGQLVGIGSASEPIIIALDPPASGAGGCFELCETDDGSLEPNAIVQVVEGEPGIYQVFLDRPITPYAITRIRYTGDGSGIQYTSHPGNVDASSYADADDVLHLIDTINGQAECPYGLYSCDVDRSGAINSGDVLREIDVLNGADLPQGWNDTLVPQNFAVCP